MGLVVLTVAFIGVGGAAIDDYFDRESDDVIHPDRPITSHQISLAKAFQFFALMFVAELLVSFVIKALVLELPHWLLLSSYFTVVFLRDI